MTGVALVDVLVVAVGAFVRRDLLDRLVGMHLVTAHAFDVVVLVDRGNRMGVDDGPLVVGEDRRVGGRFGGGLAVVAALREPTSP